MNYKKILAGFLSATMFLPSVKCVTPDISDNSKIISNSSGKKFDKKTKVGIGIGSGALLVLGAPSLVYWIYKQQQQKNGTLKEQTRKMCERAEREVNHYIKENVICLNNALPKDENAVSAFYYGKDAFKNLLSDTQSDDTNGSYKNSTCIIHKYDEKYMFMEPVFIVKGKLNRFVQMCTIPWEFVKYGYAESMYRLADVDELSDTEKNEENEKTEYDYLHFRPTMDSSGICVVVRVHKVKNTVEWKCIYMRIGVAEKKWASLNYDPSNDVWSAPPIK